MRPDTMLGYRAPRRVKRERTAIWRGESVQGDRKVRKTIEYDSILVVVELNAKNRKVPVYA